MPEFSLRTVRISLAIMTISGYLALATTDAFGPEIAFAPLILIACMRFFERLDARSPAYRRLSRTVSLVFTILIVPYLFAYLLSGLTAIILYIQAYLFLHGKGVKEYRYLFLMAFFLLVDAVAQSPNPVFGLIIPVFVLSAVWAFASVQIYAETEANKQGNIADLLPSEFRRGFLPPEVALWVTGGQRERMTVAPVLTGVSMGCVVVTLLFFLFTPRLDAGIFGRDVFPVQTQRAGLDDGVNLSQGGRIAADEAPVFMVRFPEEESAGPPDLGEDLYWRVTSYNRLIGAEWDRVDGDFQYVEWRRRYDGRLERDPPYSGRRVTQEVFIQDSNGLTGLPALPGAYRFKPSTAARLIVDDTENMTVQVTDSTSQGLSYRVDSRIPDWSREEFAAAPPDYPGTSEMRSLMNRYTQHRITERTRVLAENLTQGMDSPYEKAVAIENYLKNPANFVYTTLVDSLSTTDPIDDFLFVRRRGHCELFASAMCVMLRSVGVPTRVASGFRDGDWSKADGAYIVRRRHAHLWVEVYLYRVGWVMFDPSGAAEPDNSTMAVLRRALGRFTLMSQYIYYRDIVGYSSGIQLRSLMQFSIGLFRFDVDLMRSSLPQLRMVAKGLPTVVIGVCFALALLWGFYLMYRSASLKRRSGPALSYSRDQARATRVYALLRRRLAALGSDVQGGGARELVTAVELNPAIEASAVSRIVRAYQESRFGGRPMDRKRYDELVRAIRLVKRQVQKG